MQGVPVIKVGRTDNVRARMGAYPTYSHCLQVTPVTNARLAEAAVLAAFKRAFLHRTDLGREWFQPPGEYEEACRVAMYMYHETLIPHVRFFSVLPPCLAQCVPPALHPLLPSSAPVSASPFSLSARPTKPQQPAEIKGGEAYWEIRAIVGHEPEAATRRQDVRAYRVWWVGFPEAEATLEPAATLLSDAPVAVRRYWAGQRDADVMPLRRSARLLVKQQQQRSGSRSRLANLDEQERQQDDHDHSQRAHRKRQRP